jgi:hypothetical protein
MTRTSDIFIWRRMGLLHGKRGKASIREGPMEGFSVPLHVVFPFGYSPDCTPGSKSGLPFWSIPFSASPRSSGRVSHVAVGGSHHLPCPRFIVMAL